MTRTLPPRLVPATARATYEAKDDQRGGFQEELPVRCPDKNVLGRYAFTIQPPAELRPLRDPNARDSEDDDEF
jgi:hypothetical protein